MGSFNSKTKNTGLLRWYLKRRNFKIIDDDKVTFTIWAEKYYDAEGNEQVGGVDNPNSYFTASFDAKSAVISPVGEQFPWWWILVGIARASVIAMLIWVIIAKRKNYWILPHNGHFKKVSNKVIDKPTAKIKK